MEIYSWPESLPLFEEWKLSREIENAAVAALHDALKSEKRNIKIILSLTKTMEDSHKEAMDVFDRLQKFKIDSE